ncbi:ATPase containing protein [Cellulophaga phage phi46:3]|uniref:ATPase containing protein n=1 Tax=Cellulophaga phage phi46:3 TaxID=1327985 RepID=S0A069_9CAUD|nr:ATPase containing protein [Cellulophaga phage phi46:3]AGO48766.1 ATPase containing protein [Cellulophaga phage phi46:3]
MKHIELKRLELRYFKGAKEVNIDFNHITSIFGDNGTGKSTIGDAFSWLFFGKNMIGESDSKSTIKTLDENNVAIPKLDHSVKAILDVDGEEITLTRILSEKWTKKKGALETVFEGNITKYFYNNVPKSKKEYEEKISNILDELIFKMISDPLAFNALHWEKQRELLISIAGNVSNLEIAAGNKEFEALLSKLVGKDLDEYKKELAATRLLHKKSIESIPTRIDEQIKSKPEGIDFKEAEGKKVELETKIAEIDSKIDDKNKTVEIANAKRNEVSNEVFALKTKNQNIEFEVKKKVNSLAGQLEDPISLLNAKISAKENTLEKYAKGVSDYIYEKQKDLNSIIEIENTLSKLRKDFDIENAKSLKFDEENINCPSCKRPLDSIDAESKKEKMLLDFKEEKNHTLLSINTNGQANKLRKETLESRVSETSKRILDGEKLISETKKELESLKEELKKESGKESVDPVNPEADAAKILSTHKEYQANIETITTLESTLEEAKTVDISDLKVQKTAIQNDLQVVNDLLSKKNQIAEIEKRVEELSKEESKLAQLIADIEKQEFVAQSFTIAKVSQIEDKVNALFEVTKFKLFETQVNGSEVPTCKATYLGVDFNILNSAGKIHCGTEIINALCKFYKVQGPIFLDNAESVTETPKTDSQLIRLVVSKPDKTLRIV